MMINGIGGMVWGVKYSFNVNTSFAIFYFCECSLVTALTMSNKAWWGV